ncbi:MAG TPA: alpha/beta hydrolase-fold protein [Hyphomonas sp.]|nr:alpha/beta hydrolase-fold protein [Hyphomonas sp.]
MRASRLLAPCVTAILTGLFPAPSAFADDIETLRAEVESETRCYVSPGPKNAGPRAICVWRPAIAKEDTLPTLYMADGMTGIYVATIPLKRAIENGTVAPLMVVGLDPRPAPEDRAQEYVRHFRGKAAYEAHNHWFIEYVIPWTERTQKAAADQSRRYVGGFSNGADWATTTATEHAALFAGALIHSPVMTRDKSAANWKNSGASALRWVITGGKQEVSGTIKAKADLPKKMSRSLLSSGAEVRSCIGSWKHELRAWRKISGGAITWLAQLGDPALVASPEEFASCE